jgi:hypothetical protein
MDEEYLYALGAWDSGHWSTALQAATAVLEEQPDHDPARLIAGYSMVKLGQLDEGLVELEVVAEEATDPDTQKRADLLLRWYRDRWRRNQLAFTLGTSVGAETLPGGPEPLGGYAAVVHVPVWNTFSANLDVSGAWRDTAGSLDIRGPRLALLVDYALPLARGLFHLDAAAGPSVWFAKGGYWPDGGQVYAGMRGAVGIDVRPKPRLGFRFEVGSSIHPGVRTVVPWYSTPFDVRIAITNWTRLPRR